MKLGVIHPGHYSGPITTVIKLAAFEPARVIQLQEPPQESQATNELNVMKHLGENHKAPKIGFHVVNPL